MHSEKAVKKILQQANKYMEKHGGEKLYRRLSNQEMMMLLCKRFEK